MLLQLLATSFVLWPFNFVNHPNILLFRKGVRYFNDDCFFSDVKTALVHKICSAVLITYVNVAKSEKEVLKSIIVGSKSIIVNGI